MNTGQSRHAKFTRATAVFLLALPLAGCGAGTVATQAVKTTAKAAGTAARVTMDGVRATSGVVTKPFRRDRDERDER